MSDADYQEVGAVSQVASHSDRDRHLHHSDLCQHLSPLPGNLTLAHPQAAHGDKVGGPRTQRPHSGSATDRATQKVPERHVTHDA